MKESIIKWQTGEPNESGSYLVTTRDGFVSYEKYIKYGDEPVRKTLHAYHTEIIAHCRFSDIEPYKE